MTADWLGASRRAAERAATPRERSGTAERVRETGTGGEGGDHTLVIDADAEAASSSELDGAARGGRALHRDQRGARRGRLRLAGHPRDHRPDRRLHQRQARPAAPLDLDRRRRRADDGRRLLRLRLRLRAGGGVDRAARRRGLPRRRAAGHRRPASGARETASSSCSGSSPRTRAGSATPPTSSPRPRTGSGRWGRSRSRSARSPAARLDAHGHAAALAGGRRRRGPADRPRGGRPGLPGLRRSARRAPRPRAALARRRRAPARSPERAARPSRVRSAHPASPDRAS